MSRRIIRDVLLRKLRLERSYRPPALLRHPEWNYDAFLALVVGQAAAARPDLSFLQVGGFDGQANDPILPLVRKYGLRGVIAEPQPAAFGALSRVYAEHSQVTLVNAAVSKVDEVRDFHSVDGGPSQVASFDRGHLRRHGIPESRIVTQPVECLTVATLLRRAGLSRVDVVQIDAEGYDFEIIKSIDLAGLAPLVLRFEHAHLSNRDADACVALLAGHGYRLITERRDLVAIRQE